MMPKPMDLRSELGIARSLGNELGIAAGEQFQQFQQISGNTLDMDLAHDPVRESEWNRSRGTEIL